MLKKENQNLSKEKLLAKIERLKKELKKKKKYGLIWEDKPEDVVEMCKEKLPVLKEVKSKEIITDKNKPMNLLIEGDNYHALSVLNYTHKGKIDVIYIAPPYNTGNKDFIYNDHYVDREDSYRHSKWLSFMEKRLKLAKMLLSKEGVIFISIDDNEQAQLRLLCDSIFGEKNFVGEIIRKTKSMTGDQGAGFNLQHEILSIYSKNKNFVKLSGDDKNYDNYKNLGNDPKGDWVSGDPSAKSGSEGTYFEIENPYTKRKDLPPNGRYWAFSKSTLKKYISDGKIEFKKSYKGKERGFIFNRYKSELITTSNPVGSLLAIENEYMNQVGTKELKDLFSKEVFSNPKPVFFIKKLISCLSDKEIITLDFMAGSGTTGHAVLELNKEDGGNRKFILCTNNENNNGNGYKIAEDICYPRIEKVIKGYKNLKGEEVEALGGNLKYFKTDFVEYKEATDKNKIKLTKEAVEMLCVKEGTFELVLNNEDFKIFKDHDHYAGIIFNQLAIKDFKKAIRDIKSKFSVYIFSLGDDSFEDEFEDIKQKVKLSPIPEAILKVYRRIYK